MAKATMYCQACGIKVQPAQIKSGDAVQVGNRAYCPEHQHYPKPSPSSRKAAAQPQPRRRKRPTRTGSRIAAAVPPHARRRPAKSNNATTLIAVAGVAVVVIILLVVAMGAGEGTRDAASNDSGANVGAGDKEVAKTPETKKPDPPGKKKPEEPAPDPREVKAAKILEEAKKYAADHAGDPVAVVKHLRALYFDVENTSVEREFKSLLDATQVKADAVQMSARIDELLAKAAAIQKKDPEFEKRKEVKGTFGEAARVAEKFAKNRVSDVKSAESNYQSDWERAAADAVRKIASDARDLAAQEKFTEALGRLDDLPEAFAGAPAAKELETVREEISDLQAKAAKKKKDGGGGGGGGGKGDFAKYEGTYSNDQLNASITINVENGQLTATITGPISQTIPLTHDGGHKFSASGQGQSVTLEFNVSGDKATSVDVSAMGQDLTFERD